MEMYILFEPGMNYPLHIGISIKLIYHLQNVFFLIIKKMYVHFTSFVVYNNKAVFKDKLCPL